MKVFSQRYGYSQVDDTFVREKMTEAVENAICNCCDDLKKSLEAISFGNTDYYRGMEEVLWRYFLNRRLSDFGYGYSHRVVLVDYIKSKDNPWYKKLDILENALRYLYALSERNSSVASRVNHFVYSLNSDFKRLNYAYRIIDKQIVEVTSEEEITSIKKALEENKDNIKEHMTKALEHCSQRPTGDYRNSIKESISAVEALCREKTGESTLGKALQKLEKNGVVIPATLNAAFDKLYTYTNQPDTGIRHAIMDDDGKYTPGVDEAVFMLVSCSAFINYLNKK